MLTHATPPSCMHVLRLPAEVRALLSHNDAALAAVLEAALLGEVLMVGAIYSMWRAAGRRWTPLNAAVAVCFEPIALVRVYWSVWVCACSADCAQMCVIAGILQWLCYYSPHVACDVCPCLCLCGVAHTTAAGYSWHIDMGWATACTHCCQQASPRMLGQQLPHWQTS